MNSSGYGDLRPTWTSLPGPSRSIVRVSTPKDQPQLAAWGVAWPPPMGWKNGLTERWYAAQRGRPAVGDDPSSGPTAEGTRLRLTRRGGQPLTAWRSEAARNAA